MARIYRQRHPEKTILYRVLFHHFEEFLSEYDSRFEKAYAYIRPVVQKVVEKYLDCGNPFCGATQAFMSTAKFGQKAKSRWSESVSI